MFVIFLPLFFGFIPELTSEMIIIYFNNMIRTLHVLSAQSDPRIMII